MLNLYTGDFLHLQRLTQVGTEKFSTWAAGIPDALFICSAFKTGCPHNTPTQHSAPLSSASEIHPKEKKHLVSIEPPVLPNTILQPIPI